MMSLKPHERIQAGLASPHERACAGSPRSPHASLTARMAPRRTWTALLALIGLLIWGGLAAPQVMAFIPQFASLSQTTTRWLSDAATLLRAGQPAGAALGSVTAPQVCASQSVSAVGANLVVPAGEWVCDDALAIGGNLTVLGHVQGAAQAIGGTVTIAGEVDGDVMAVGGNIILQPGAHTHGHLNAIGGQVLIAQGAVVDEPLQSVAHTWYGGHMTPTTFNLLTPEASSFWLGLLFWISAALGLTTFLPEAVGHVRYIIARRFVLSGISGMFIGVVGALLGVALFLTCLGIPITLLIGLGIWLAWVIGTVAFGSWLGATLLRGGRRDRDPSLLASTLLGVVLLTLLKSLPFAGPVVALLVGCVALGAASLTLLSARRVSYARLRW